MKKLLKAIESVLCHNGGQLNKTDTVDGVDYVMVRKKDFLALNRASKKFCFFCYGTGKLAPGFFNIHDKCSCTEKK